MAAQSSETIRAYLDDVSRTPLLTRDEERALADEIRRARARLCRKVLSCDFLLRAAARTAEQIGEGRLRIERFADLPRTSPAERVLACRRFQRVGRKLRRMLRANRADFKATLDRKQPPGQRLDALTRLRRRRRRAAALAARLNLRVAHLQPWLQRLARLHQSIASLEAQRGSLARTPETRPLRGELRSRVRRLVRRVGRTPGSLRRYLDTVRRLQEAYRAACRKLTLANLRLVVALAKKYGKNDERLLDLVQEGSLGLMRAVEKYDAARGVKFATYATWWVRQAIGRAVLRQGYCFPMTDRTAKKLCTLQKATKEWLLTNRSALRAEDAARKLGVSPQEAEALLRIQHGCRSLDEPRDTEDCGLAEVLRDPRDILPPIRLDRSALRSRVDCLLNGLSAHEREVVHLRFGLSDGHVRSLADIGAALCISRERVRQIESAALDKLRQPIRARALSQFLDEPDVELLRAASLLRKGSKSVSRKSPENRSEPSQPLVGERQELVVVPPSALPACDTNAGDVNPKHKCDR